ncbi:hypothetical protein [Paenirhodobacter populi]|uniref:Uncharacterized protein n=1 Tax=Paenirhodobacter populi TaxID=2306993 RepID=A0A443JN42_9RHOB|nr:hypothetical protein [Sinirhodobacter populi]RWR21912.1 hypothetical protein D2T30_07835 [Sinirhodobacter populi]RWR31282.1 hypothetical protein D2T31_04550 [Sinirhodobacter populi]
MRRALCILAAFAILCLAIGSHMLDFRIGERATGGYDGAPSISPDQLERAQREARDAAAQAERAATGTE